MSAPGPDKITPNTAQTQAFIVKHFDKPEVDHSADCLLEQELARILSAKNIMSSTAGAAPQESNIDNPRILRTDSFPSTSDSIHSEVSNTSTVGTTPYHSRSASKVEETKPPGLSSSRSITNLSDALEEMKIKGTGLDIPRNATPSQIPKTQPHKRDPWTLSYPAPTTEVNIAACLARPKLAGTPFERLQAARTAISPAQRDGYDAKQAADVEARHKVLQREHFENTIKNLTRPLGYAAAFNKAPPIKRPQTFMNGYRWYEEFDKKEGGFRKIQGQTVKYASVAPPSKQVAEEDARRQNNVEQIWDQ